MDRNSGSTIPTTIRLARWTPKNRGGPTRSISCSVLKGVEMTNETIKVVLMVMLLGGLRTAIFVTEMPKSQPWLVYQTFLDWMIALVWPAMPEPATGYHTA